MPRNSARPLGRTVPRICPLVIATIRSVLPGWAAAAMENKTRLATAAQKSQPPFAFIDPTERTKVVLISCTVAVSRYRPSQPSKLLHRLLDGLKLLDVGIHRVLFEIHLLSHGE